MLEILGKASSINVRKVLWLAAELELPYLRHDWGSGFRDTRVPEFLALNPNALVPVIRDGGLVLWESNTICRYLAGRHGRTDLLPAEPAARHRARPVDAPLVLHADRASPAAGGAGLLRSARRAPRVHGPRAQRSALNLV